jgi:hypothetical protein
MPRVPTTRPLNTEVIANDTPVTVPTSPLARSRRSSGTRSVTQVESTMLRIEPATDPIRVSATSTHNHTPRRRSRSGAGTATNTSVARAKHAADAPVASTIAACLRLRSTNVPNAGPMKADERLKAAPITPVTITDRVSM